ncbi:MAG: EamA family transporter [Lentisphaeria bacterium]|nr:EamA family transporter [Lentisphaeria bacterium]
MLTGIICGLLTAFLQPVAYLLSRQFFVRGGRAMELTIYSQLIMGVISAVLLLCCWPILSFDSALASRTAWSVGTILIAQVCYFLAIRVVEASRLSSMLGLKIIFLVLLNMLLFGEQLRLLHWLAVGMCAIAGLIMNQSGLKISLKALAAIICCCFFLAASDIADYRLVIAIPVENPVYRGILATGFCYAGLGLISLPGLFFLRFDWQKCRSAIPYSCVWMAAMVVFYLSIGLLGTVFTSIIQSSRGLISVILGALVAWLGYAGMESRASKAIWLSRLAAALLIMAAVAIFTSNPL